MQLPMWCRLSRRLPLGFALGLAAGSVAASAAAPRASASPPRVSSTPRVVKHGRTIDLELQAVDVRAVLPTLGEIGRVNFVLGPGVQGEVTAYLEGVTWEEALHWICRAMHFRARRSGNVIYIERD